jgi:heme-degrading monooxygenase HmoA
MFVAMNRFKVALGSEEAFEEVWRSRKSRLDELPGFVQFHLLRGPATDAYTLYASHTVWADEAAFRAWTTSA